MKEFKKRKLKMNHLYCIFIRTILTLVVVNGGLAHGQNMVVEGGMTIENTLVVENVLDVAGAMILDVSTIQLTSDDQTLTFTESTKPYIRIGSNTSNASARTLLLSHGINFGQTIFLECACEAAAWELLDNPSPGGNVNLVANRTFTKGSIIQLIWNGFEWLEMHFSDN